MRSASVVFVSTVLCLGDRYSLRRHSSLIVISPAARREEREKIKTIFSDPQMSQKAAGTVRLSIARVSPDVSLRCLLSVFNFARRISSERRLLSVCFYFLLGTALPWTFLFACSIAIDWADLFAYARRLLASEEREQRESSRGIAGPSEISFESSRPWRQRRAHCL